MVVVASGGCRWSGRKGEGRGRKRLERWRKKDTRERERRNGEKKLIFEMDTYHNMCV